MNFLERKVLAIVRRVVTPLKEFDDVRCFDDKGVLMVKIDGHRLKITVADMGECDD